MAFQPYGLYNLNNREFIHTNKQQHQHQPMTTGENKMAEIKRRSVASNVILSIDTFVQVRVDLLSARPTDTNEFKSLCPQCDQPEKLMQKYICAHNHGPFTSNEVAHGREIDKVLYTASDEDYAEVKAPTVLDPKAPIQVRVFKAEEVTASTRPTGTSYLLRSQKSAEAAYVALAACIKDNKLAFLAEIVVRNSQKLYRIELWNEQLVLQELIRPNELAQAEAVVAHVPAQALKMMKEVIAAKVEKNFNVHDFRYLAPERMAELDERLISKKPAKKSKKTQVTIQNDGQDLLEALKASVAANQPKAKKPAKVTPIKKAS